MFKRDYTLVNIESLTIESTSAELMIPLLSSSARNMGLQLVYSNRCGKFFLICSFSFFSMINQQ